MNRYLRPPEDRIALVEPARSLGRDYEAEAVEVILRETSGYPYFTQLYGDLLWRGTPADPIKLMDFQRLQPEIESVLDRGSYESRYLRTTARERAVLHSIAREGEQATLRQIQAASGLTNNVSAAGASIAEAQGAGLPTCSRIGCILRSALRRVPPSTWG